MVVWVCISRTIGYTFLSRIRSRPKCVRVNTTNISQIFFRTTTSFSPVCDDTYNSGWPTSLSCGSMLVSSPLDRDRRAHCTRSTPPSDSKSNRRLWCSNSLQMLRNIRPMPLLRTTLGDRNSTNKGRNNPRCQSNTKSRPVLTRVTLAKMLPMNSHVSCRASSSIICECDFDNSSFSSATGSSVGKVAGFSKNQRTKRNTLYPCQSLRSVSVDMNMAAPW